MDGIEKRLKQSNYWQVKLFPKGNGQRLMSAGNEQRRFHGTKT
ncbi:10804_t:CDS:1, partial [Gigaspora rosea]